jgi:hypothetical protein
MFKSVTYPEAIMASIALKNYFRIVKLFLSPLTIIIIFSADFESYLYQAFQIKT